MIWCPSELRTSASSWPCNLCFDVQQSQREKSIKEDRARVSDSFYFMSYNCVWSPVGQTSKTPPLFIYLDFNVKSIILKWATCLSESARGHMFCQNTAWRFSCCAILFKWFNQSVIYNTNARSCSHFSLYPCHCFFFSSYYTNGPISTSVWLFSLTTGPQRVIAGHV